MSDYIKILLELQACLQILDSKHGIGEAVKESVANQLSLLLDELTEYYPDTDMFNSLVLLTDGSWDMDSVRETIIRLGLVYGTARYLDIYEDLTNWWIQRYYYELIQNEDLRDLSATFTVSLINGPYHVVHGDKMEEYEEAHSVILKKGTNETVYIVFERDGMYRGEFIGNGNTLSSLASDKQVLDELTMWCEAYRDKMIRQLMILSQTSHLDNMVIHLWNNIHIYGVTDEMLIPIIDYVTDLDLTDSDERLLFISELSHILPGS